MEKKKSIFVLCQRFGFLSLLSYCLMAVLHLAITSSSSVSVCLPAAAAGFDHLNICGYFYFQPPLHFIVASMRRSVIRREMFSSVSLPRGSFCRTDSWRQGGKTAMSLWNIHIYIFEGKIWHAPITLKLLSYSMFMFFLPENKTRREKKKHKSLEGDKEVTLKCNKSRIKNNTAIYWTGEE